MSRAVVVTGASTGIGEATALRLAGAGWQVFAGVRTDADAHRLRNEAGQRLTTVHLDVTDAGSIDGAVALVRDAVGPDGLGGLVNNAGIGRGGPIEYIPSEDWRTQFEVGVIGQVAVTRAFLPLLRMAQGRIIFIGSMGGRLASPYIAPYSAAKHALEAIAESLRQELRPAGIRVVLIEPGAVKTPIWEKALTSVDELEQSLPPEALDRYQKLIAAQRKLIKRQAAAGIPADHVASAIESALTSTRPPARHLVGRDAKAVGLLSRVLPDRARDALQAKLIGW